MIQSRLRELIAGKSRLERRRITYDDILAKTGISKTTLTKLANDKVGGISFSTIERLCKYFGCQPGDLIIYIDESGQT